MLLLFQIGGALFALWRRRRTLFKNLSGDLQTLKANRHATVGRHLEDHFSHLCLGSAGTDRSDDMTALLAHWRDSKHTMRPLHKAPAPAVSGRRARVQIAEHVMDDIGRYVKVSEQLFHQLSSRLAHEFWKPQRGRHLGGCSKQLPCLSPFFFFTPLGNIAPLLCQRD